MPILLYRHHIGSAEGGGFVRCMYAWVFIGPKNAATFGFSPKAPHVLLQLLSKRIFIKLFTVLTLFLDCVMH